MFRKNYSKNEVNRLSCKTCVKSLNQIYWSLADHQQLNLSYLALAIIIFIYYYRQKRHIHYI